MSPTTMSPTTMSPTTAPEATPPVPAASKFTRPSSEAIRNRILSSQRRDHRFFLTMAILGSLAVFIGYSQTYYLKPIQALGAMPVSPALTTLVHIHAAVMSLYVLFYVLQTALVSGGRRILHMTLGWASVAFIPLMVVLGSFAVLYGAKMGHKQIWPDVEIAALINVWGVYIFAIFAIAGILLRKKPESHRRLMLMSFVQLLPPPITRIHFVQQVGPAGTFIGVFAFFLAGPIYDLITRRRIHPAYIVTVPFAIVTSPPLLVAIGSTPAWHHFIDSLIR